MNYQKFLEEYFTHLSKVKGYSENTISSYKNDLNSYFTISGNSCFIDNDIKAYIKKLQNKKNQQAGPTRSEDFSKEY